MAMIKMIESFFMFGKIINIIKSL